MKRTLVLTIFLCVLSASLLRAQDANTDAPVSTPDVSRASGDPAARSRAELAKALANPLANLITVPFQSTWAAGLGSENSTGFVFKLQPVIPVQISDDWNLIARLIVPMMSEPALGPSGSASSGLGDVQFSAFLSPAHAGALTWGVGPVLSLPSTSAPALGTQKWSGGPTAAAIVRQGSWTYGALANQLW